MNVPLILSELDVAVNGANSVSPEIQSGLIGAAVGTILGFFTGRLLENTRLAAYINANGPARLGEANFNTATTWIGAAVGGFVGSKL